MKEQALTWLQVLPFITFLFALITGGISLYVVNKLGKLKEEILITIRGEIEKKIINMESKMASQEQVAFVKTELKLILDKIELKIDFAADKLKLIEEIRRGLQAK